VRAIARRLRISIAFASAGRPQTVRWQMTEARQNGFESGRDAARRIEDPFYRTQALLAAIEGLAAR